MNEAISPSPKVSKRLIATKIFSYFFLITTIFHAFTGIGNILFYLTSSESAIKIATTDFGRLYVDGYFGYIRMPLESLSITTADFPIENPKLFAVSLTLLIFITSKLPILFIVIQACRLLREITSSYTPFTEKTTRLIRSVGTIMLLKRLLGTFILQMGINLINFHRRWFNNPFDFTWIVIGLFVLVLADVFSKGYVLQQESDETL